MTTAVPARAYRLEKQCPPDKLVCNCWCERNVGYVKKELVLKGITFSCGHPWCRELR